ncbi:hypothetical protein [Streptomyces sp. NPDC000880]
MGTFVTLLVIMAMIALGALAIHMLNAQHDERISDRVGGFGRLWPRRRSNP